jgi:uncharacterized protein (TIGR02466 family)
MYVDKKMTNSISLFPFKIYKTRFEKHEWIKENLFSKLEPAFEASKIKNQYFQRNGNLCSYDVESDINRKFPEETKELVEFIEQASRDYWKELDYFPGLEPFVLEVWANKSPKGGYIASHLHLSLPLTAVYYVDASPEQGNIIFENPNDLLLSAQPVNYLSGRYQFEHEVAVNSGDLLIFPGFLKHKTVPNNTDRPRLVLGISISARGFYWQKNWVGEESNKDIEQIINSKKPKGY